MTTGQRSAASSGLIDRATVERFRTGDVGALGQIYDRFAGAVLGMAMTVLRDRALAEDATQETFLRAWRAAAQFNPELDLAPWLLTIARRTAVDVFRRESRPTLGGHALEQDAPVELPALERAWEVWQVRSALDALPEDERTVVRMAHFGSMTHAEIADELQVPVGTVKSRSHRAHRRLAGMLGHLKDDEPQRSTEGGAS